MGGCHSETEGRTCAGLRFNPDAPAGSFDDFPAESEADTSSCDVAAVETGEHPEDAFLLFGRDADAVIHDLDDPFPAALLSADVDLGRFFGAILDRVADQVLENADEVAGIAVYEGEDIGCHDRAAFFDGTTEVLGSRSEGTLQLDGTGQFGESAAGEQKQIVKEIGHPRSGIDGISGHLLALVVQIHSVNQQLGKGGDGTERFAQIVSYGVGEFFHENVGAGEQIGIFFFLGFEGYAGADIAMVDGDGVHIRSIQQVAGGAFHPGARTIFAAHAGVPLKSALGNGEEFGKDAAHLDTIFEVNEIKAVAAHQFFRFIAKNFGSGAGGIEDLAARVDQRDRIGTVFYERAKTLK